MAKMLPIGLAIAATAGAMALFSTRPTSAVQAPMQRLTFECSTDAECAATPPCKLKPGCDGGPNSQPFRLVGYDCEGADAPLYRDEEDEFPRCAEIVPTWHME